MRVSVVQHDIAWEDPAATQLRLVPLIEQAAAAGSRLVVLTEMYATGFSMDTDRIAEPPGGPNEEFCVAQATRHGVWLAASVAQWRVAQWQVAPLPVAGSPGRGRPRNVGLLAAPDGTVHRYAKIHPFSFGGEDRHYEAGDVTLTVDVEGVRVSLLICYDLRFADTFWGLAHGTDCYVVVANWPQPRREHWRTLLAARAIENQAYVVGANRVGMAPNGLAYSGDSRIVDPLGAVLAEASQVETVLTAEVDPDRVAQVRRELPFLADRT
ncbi:MAG: carbon-nitrogen family hydrolase [Actinobacteria bacterium]|nr:carbon-nitrogen family hydrolase [Actinomycetota bacterium]MBI3688012.1 carbon-nitrogen family hydrolase [Actinomycetota bacterium]